jgi:dCMP deaminase
MAQCIQPGKWDLRFMAMAELAASFSKDPRKQVGCILVSPDCRHITLGYNGLPSGFDDQTLAIMGRDQKNKYSLHAETNAIANAATCVDGWTMYVTEAPCLSCALAIHRAGVDRVVTAPIDPNSLWVNEQKEAEGFLATMYVQQERLSA